MKKLITTLDHLNRKERFFLVASAVVGEPRFRIHRNFRDQVKRATGITIPTTARAWVDYHIDWLYAALVLQDAVNDGPFPSPRFPSGQKGKSPLNVNANQEDIDLLVAFDKGPVTHLVLIEAKGVTQFGNAQLISKGRRLKHIQWVERG